MTNNASDTNADLNAAIRRYEGIGGVSSRPTAAGRATRGSTAGIRVELSSDAAIHGQQLGDSGHPDMALRPRIPALSTDSELVLPASNRPSHNNRHINLSGYFTNVLWLIFFFLETPRKYWPSAEPLSVARFVLYWIRLCCHYSKPRSFPPKALQPEPTQCCWQGLGWWVGRRGAS